MVTVGIDIPNLTIPDYTTPNSLDIDSFVLFAFRLLKFLPTLHRPDLSLHFLFFSDGCETAHSGH